LLHAADEVPGAAGVAILSHGTWLRRYGGDPAAIGRTLVLNGAPYQVVGVLPSTFTLPREVLPTLGGAENAEIVVPLPLAADAARIRTAEDYNILAKLRAGASVLQAQVELDVLTARLRRDFPATYPPNSGLTFSVVPLHEQVVGDVRRSLVVLIGAVALVLLIACANVANLLLSRAVARQREMALRSALGATRARLVGQLLGESLLLALMGGALAVLLSFWALEWIRTLGEGSVPRLDEIALDGRVLAFTLAVSIAAAALFGLLPAIRSASVDAQAGLKDGSRGAAASRAVWAGGANPRKLLVAGELALAVVLLIGAGLLIRSFVRVQDVPPGFNPASVLTFELAMIGPKYPAGKTVGESYRLLLERIAALPIVSAAGAVSALPLSQMYAWGPITVEGRTPPAGEEFINVDIRMVAGDYFGAMQIPLVAGRAFSSTDTPDTPRVAIIDERMARELWPDQDPIGKRVRSGGAGSTSPWITVVGVVGNVKQYTLDGDSRMALYLAHQQSPARSMNVVLRAQDVGALSGIVRQTVREIDPALPLYNVREMEDRVSESLARRRFAMQLLTMFAVAAAGLAAIGVYGVMAYMVNQGTRELGVRLALGATPRRLLLLVVGQSAHVAAIGIAAGVICAFAATRFMRSLLFGIDAADPATFATIAAALSAVTLIAGFLPARRAAAIDPVVSLRAE
jgi:predicted permease